MCRVVYAYMVCAPVGGEGQGQSAGGRKVIRLVWKLGSVCVCVCVCVSMRAHAPVHTQEGHTGLQQECETCRQERQTAVSFTPTGAGRRAAFHGDWGHEALGGDRQQ